MKKLLCLGVVLIFALVSCHHTPNHITRSVYYWKTNLSIEPADYQHLDSLGIKKMYLRFFDVDIDASSKQAVPVSPIVFDKQVPEVMACVPVIYIKNRIFASLPKDSMPLLAGRIYHLVFAMCRAGGLKNVKEIQLDCDWTISSKDHYFALAKAFGDLCKSHSQLLSATIRLHQIKYLGKTGVPPVDRGMLMFYNMGKLEDTLTHNSIFDAATASRYTSNIKSYRLPLDVVLPMFSWAVQMRNGKVVGLPTINEKVLMDTANFVHEEDNHYVVKQDYNYKTATFKKGDRIRWEKCGVAESNDAARLVSEYLKNEDRTVAIFDFQPTNFFQNGHDSIAQVYKRFE